VISVRCDVTVWEDQVALFDAALQTFGKIDIVLANAGVTEHPGLGELQFMDGKPIKPDLLTTSVNTIGILYSPSITCYDTQLLKIAAQLRILHSTTFEKAILRELSNH
jgi:NAD(P)-dependent dehydrogenase (short-subunit alcohol dehydrogenase family)